MGGMVGSSVGATAGGEIGSFGGPISEKIGEIGGGFVGGMVSSACFVAGTQVVVGVNPDGSYATENIEDIQVGDYVLTRPQDDPTAPLELKEVTAVYVHQVTQEQVLSITDAQGRTETITCTSDHPFWVPGQGWVAAEDLAPGTELTSPDGSAVVVVSNTARVLDQPVNVYNFQVDGDHTYFVDDGAEPVWVHNNCSEAFKIKDWTGYPEGMPKPRGAFRLLEGGEYEAARDAANAANKAIHRADQSLAGMQIHEIKPVKFGGSPTSVANKIALTQKQHAGLTSWWNNLMRSMGG